MMEYLIRNFQPEDDNSIEEITYRTGYLGEDLTGKDYIDDKRLLYLIFIYYYPHYEPEYCFVAENKSSGKVVGFICGTPDTEIQEKRFRQLIPWRIILHTLTSTLWFNPKTISTFLKMVNLRTSINPSEYKEIKTEFPAHLHINLLPEYQRFGLGTLLIQNFEDHMRNLGVAGIHLQTTNYNKRAVPFYLKSGYKIVNELPMSHFKFPDLRLLTFAKKIF